MAPVAPVTAATFIVGWLAIAGVPPFAGFWAKWSVLRELVAAGMTWLAVVGVLFAVVGLFYYLRVVYTLYMQPLPRRRPKSRMSRSSALELQRRPPILPARFSMAQNQQGSIDQLDDIGLTFGLRQIACQLELGDGLGSGFIIRNPP